MSNKRNSYKQRINEVMAVIDTTRVRIALIALIAILGLSYLWLVNSSATSGFHLSDLETRVFELEDEYRSLELELAAVQSTERVEESAGEMQLVTATGVRYVEVETAVALNE